MAKNKYVPETIKMQPHYLPTLVGQKYGDLEVIAGQAVPSRDGYWLCECVCGSSRRVPEPQLKSGRVTMCLACEANLKMQKFNNGERNFV